MPESACQSFPLTEEGIHEVLSLIESTIRTTKSETISLPELQASVGFVLHQWQKELGEDQIFSFRRGKRLLHTVITIAAPGKKVSIFDEEEDSSLITGGNAVTTLFTDLGISPSFQYVNGENQLTIMPKRKKVNPLIPMLIAVAAGILAGLLCSLLPKEMSTGLADGVITPLFDTFVGVLVTFALPMMFLSLMWGIYSIGDLATLGSLGKGLLGRYIGRIFFSLVICAAVSALFFRIAPNFNAEVDNLFDPAFSFILGIFPSNIVTPFSEGNVLQVIFLAVIFGIALLVLNKKVPDCVKIVGQLNSIVQLIMEWITRLLPIFIFISVLNLSFKISGAELASLWQLFANIGICVVILLLLMLIGFSVRLRVGIGTLVKKLLPTSIVASATSSSAATFSTTLKTCREALGIDDKLAFFGVPLGIVFSRSGVAVVMFCTAICMANKYGVEVNFAWLILAVIVTGIMAIVVPPIPGGVTVVFSLLFLYLGIPAEALTIAIILGVVLDFIMTFMNMVAIPADLAATAKKAKMINYDVLRSDTPKKNSR